jgi:hypothetical protein
VQGLQFVPVRSSLPAVEPVKRYARRGHDHLPRWARRPCLTRQPGPSINPAPSRPESS